MAGGGKNKKSGKNGSGTVSSTAANTERKPSNKGLTQVTDSNELGKVSKKLNFANTDRKYSVQEKSSSKPSFSKLSSKDQMKLIAHKMFNEKRLEVYKTLAEDLNVIEEKIKSAKKADWQESGSNALRSRISGDFTSANEKSKLGLEIKPNTKRALHIAAYNKYQALKGFSSQVKQVKLPKAGSVDISETTASLKKASAEFNEEIKKLESWVISKKGLKNIKAFTKEYYENRSYYDQIELLEKIGLNSQNYDNPPNLGHVFNMLIRV